MILVEKRGLTQISNTIQNNTILAKQTELFKESFFLRLSLTDKLAYSSTLLTIFRS